LKYTVNDEILSSGSQASDDYPSVAVFPVSQRYTADEQQRNAKLFCEYMNKIVEATEQTYQDNALLDRLKA
jgi:hypothetical protein